MTAPDDVRLNGRYPEFSRMSLRPGIGADFMHEVGSTVFAMDEAGQIDLANPQADVPAALRHGTRILPLGRYLRKQLRKVVGKDEKAPSQTLEAAAAEMRELYAQASAAGELSSFLPKVALVESGRVKVAAAENRRKQFPKPRRL